MKDYIYKYDIHGDGYADYRKPDPEIAKIIHNALGNAGTVINIGAGTGSYEPFDKYTVAVEPSAIMRSGRRKESVPALACFAESLPFDDNSFDASMAILTIHHWIDIKTGLNEMRRVTKGPAVIVTFDMNAAAQYWLYEYAPGIVDADKKRFPETELILKTLGGKSEIKPVPVTAGCTDFFQEALYARPELFLNDDIRKTQSGWTFLPAGIEEAAIGKLRNDLKTGEWDRKYGHYRKLPVFTCGLRLIINNKNI